MLAHLTTKLARSVLRPHAQRAGSTVATIGDKGVPGYTFGQDGNPGVVCIQEWWGVTEQVLSQAQHIADQGYKVVVPDLYRGTVTLEVAEAEHNMGSLDFPGAVEDICIASSWLKGETGAPKVAVVGFCMGGALTVASTVNCADVDAGVAFYGTCPDGLADASTCQKPLLGLFGSEDLHEGFADRAAAEALRGKLARSPAAADCEVIIYEGLGHGFMNHMDQFQQLLLSLGNPPVPEGIRDQAWDTTFQFLNKHVGA